MGAHHDLGQRVQILGGIGVIAPDDGRRIAEARFERLEHLMLAHPAVHEKFFDLQKRIGLQGAVTGGEKTMPGGQQALERCHVERHVAVGRSHPGRAFAQHHVARHEPAAFADVETAVSRRVSGRQQHVDLLCADDEGLFAPKGVRVGGQGKLGDGEILCGEPDLGITPLAQSARTPGMVGMQVGEQYMARTVGEHPGEGFERFVGVPTGIEEDAPFGVEPEYIDPLAPLQGRTGEIQAGQAGVGFAHRWATINRVNVMVTEDHPTASLARSLFRLVLSMADPRAAVADALADRPKQPFLVLGGGKAARAMGLGALDRFPDGLHGALAAPGGHASPQGAIRLLAAGHPLPDAGSLAVVDAQERLLAQSTDPVLFLLSGGASAMLGAPVAGLSLEDLRGLSRALLAGGLDIHAMNTLRRHVLRWGGGKFAQRARRAIETLIVSDVLDDDPAAIGSGPTVPEPSGFAEALAVADALDRVHPLPPAVLRHLRAGVRGEIPPNPAAADQAFARTQWRIVLSNRTVVLELSDALGELGPGLLPPRVGDVEVVAADWAERIRASDSPSVFIAGGEPTVRLAGEGIGGRNQHLALSVAARLATVDDWLFLSIATDGMDGNSHAAGGWTDAASARRDAAGIARHLARFDSGTWCAEHGRTFPGGPTGSNVADIHIAIRGVRALGDRILKRAAGFQESNQSVRSSAR